MNTYAANTPDTNPDPFRTGMIAALALHGALAIALLAAAVLTNTHHQPWGEDASQVGAIQASMVSALPLPPKVPPVDKQVLATDNPSPAPKPPPKAAAEPPPKPTDIPIKTRTPTRTPPRTAAEPAPEPPKHPQPTPPTPKASAGDAATQLPQAVTELRNGTSAITVQDRTFGARYAYYVRGMSRVITDSYYQQDIDPRSAQGRSVTISFDIEHDGTLTNIRLASKSGSVSLDTAALRAFQRIDTFGPLPSGDHVPVQWTLEYHVP